MDKKLIISVVTYCVVSGVKCVMDKAVEVAVVEIVKQNLPKIKL